MRDPRSRAKTLVRIQRDRMPYLFVGGLEIEAEGHSSYTVHNPTNGETLARCPTANANDVLKAIEAATVAHEDDRDARGPRARGALLWRIAEQIQEEADDLAILEALQTGRTFRDVLDNDIQPGVAALRYYAGYCDKLGGTLLTLGEGRTGRSERASLRSAALVLPDANPLGTLLRRIGPPLALGTGMIVKAPEGAPLSVLKFAQILNTHGVPRGLFNVLTGAGETVSELLAGAKHLDALFFSGPIDLGRRMLVGSAKSNLKPVHLDLGSNPAAIVFDDASLQRAFTTIGSQIFSSQCSNGLAPSRLIVHESVFDQAAQALVSRARKTIVGDPLDEHTELGAMLSKAHMERVLKYAELGRREGAKLVAGGIRDQSGTHAEGFFVEPTLFLNVTRDMRIARENVGGPLLTVSVFTREEQAIQLANATRYGKYASVWTQDVGRIERVRRALKASLVWVNEKPALDPHLSVSGTDLSGHSVELGIAAFEAFTRIRGSVVSHR